MHEYIFLLSFYIDCLSSVSMEKPRKLKIAMIAPAAERVPPPKYGGTERVVSSLTEELVKRGHDVTLFATGDSITSAKLDSAFPISLREAGVQNHYGLNEWTALHIGRAYMKQREFDIIHDHNSVFGLNVAQFSKTPVVMTIHGNINKNNKRLYETFTNPYYVSISRAQVKHFPDIQTQTIYNGLNMKNYPFAGYSDGYLLYVGRIDMEKGTHLAIDVAQALDLPLVIAAKLDKQNIPYFNEYIKPRLIGERIKWIGEINEQERNELMTKALCLLHPVTWNEPFGLTMIEAMATGCPVVALDKGSTSEIVLHGKTGFVVNDLDELIEAVDNIGIISRNYCRSYSLRNFNSEIMTDRYENYYYRILQSVGKFESNPDEYFKIFHEIDKW